MLSKPYSLCHLHLHHLNNHHTFREMILTYCQGFFAILKILGM